MTPQIDAASAHEAAAEVQLLDVREQYEWDSGHIPGAVHVPMGQLNRRLDEVAEDRRIVCVCRSGQRSAAVTDALVRAGYDAVNLDGGMLAWATAGLPMTAAGEGVPRVA